MRLFLDCPICGEVVPAFDRQHMKTKHPEYFLESKKWRNAEYALFAPMFISVVLFGYFGETSQTLMSDGFLAILLAFLVAELYVLKQVKRLIDKHKV